LKKGGKKKGKEALRARTAGGGPGKCRRGWFWKKAGGVVKKGGRQIEREGRCGDNIGG